MCTRDVGHMKRAFMHVIFVCWNFVVVMKRTDKQALRWIKYCSAAKHWCFVSTLSACCELTGERGGKGVGGGGRSIC